MEAISTILQELLVKFLTFLPKAIVSMVILVISTSDVVHLTTAYRLELAAEALGDAFGGTGGVVRADGGSTTVAANRGQSEQSHLRERARQEGEIGTLRRTVARLQQYRWPGNIRELQNAIERLCVTCDLKIDENLVVTNDLILTELVPFLRVKNQRKIIKLLNIIKLP